MIKKTIIYRSDRYIIKISPLQDKFLVQLSKNFESMIYHHKIFSTLKEAKNFVTNYFKSFFVFVEL